MSTINIILLIISFSLWSLFIYKSNKDSLHFFKFLVGSVGLFLFLCILRKYTFESLLMNVTIKLLSLVGNFSGYFSVSTSDYMVTVKEGAEKLSFFVSNESSGVIEIMGYVSMLIFFPLHKLLTKIMLLIVGIISFLIMNILRIIAICLLVKFFGTDFYTFIDVFFTRTIFLLFMIVFYYFVFTKPHIKEQRIGADSIGK